MAQLLTAEIESVDLLVVNDVTVMDGGLLTKVFYKAGKAGDRTK